MSQFSWPLWLSASVAPLTLKSLEFRTCFSIPWRINSVHDCECDLSYFVWQIFMWLGFAWGLIGLYIDASLVIEMRLTPLLFYFLLTNNHCNLQRNYIGNLFTSSNIKANSHSTVFCFPILLFTIFRQLPFLSPLIYLSFSTSPSFLHYFWIPHVFLPVFMLSPVFFFLFLVAFLLPIRKSQSAFILQKWRREVVSKKLPQLLLAESRYPDHSGCTFRLKAFSFNIALSFWWVSAKQP